MPVRIILWCCALSTVTAVLSCAQTVDLSTLVSFNEADGAYSTAALVEGSDGNFYGTTYSGGVHDFGTVFKVTPLGMLIPLYSFSSSDGANPYAGLLAAPDGSFYGTTYWGGANNLGTIFQITQDGSLTTTYTFSGSDGANPFSGLILAADGNLYGTTERGGTSAACRRGCGTVFRVTPQGSLTTLHSFRDTDGAYPQAGLLQTSDGSLYGTTFGGGKHKRGTFFQIATTGAWKTLHSFRGADGTNPSGNLALAANGTIYGTTYRGGAMDYGTVFQYATGAKVATLYAFRKEGQNPLGGVIQASDGNLYGATYNSGSYGYGIIFKITPAGAFTFIAGLIGYYESYQGASCRSGLLEGSDGNLYGTTTAGGSYDHGVVFVLATGFPSGSRFPVPSR